MQLWVTNQGLLSQLIPYMLLPLGCRALSSQRWRRENQYICSSSAVELSSQRYKDGKGQPWLQYKEYTVPKWKKLQIQTYRTNRGLHKTNTVKSDIFHFKNRKRRCRWNPANLRFKVQQLPIPSKGAHSVRERPLPAGERCQIQKNCKKWLPTEDERGHTEYTELWKNSHSCRQNIQYVPAFKRWV